ncbi:MAG TPA: AraC family transcriptional regulator ligand-binding domain-containing protein [Polyangiaceae bacterium]|nr:AraC family transcriptional regulator ligand-binding domain-containing protein [Polyangiaceae bacterium]
MVQSAENGATVSIRMLWPFARLFGQDERGIELLAEHGVALADFGNPDLRLPHDSTMSLLERAAKRFDMPTIGLDAAKHSEQGDFDVLEYAARSMKNFGEAMHVMARYQRIMDSALDSTLTTNGEHAYWQTRVRGRPMPAAGNDYVVAMAIAFSKRNTAIYVPPVEVQLMHPRPAYASAYEQHLETRVTFDAPENVIVMHKSRLQCPMLQANPIVAGLFELQVRRLDDRLKDSEGIAGRVRDGLAGDLRAGTASMRTSARRLGMGVATLRRRLEDEGTTFSAIVDDLRKQLAERHLTSAGATVSEVAFLLGFSDVRAFGRAFRRWTGQSPSEFRAARSM